VGTARLTCGRSRNPPRTTSSGPNVKTSRRSEGVSSLCLSRLVGRVLRVGAAWSPARSGRWAAFQSRRWTCS
jgi:hypothetical protein